jgi:para-nitrobenzyl esterase
MVISGVVCGVLSALPGGAMAHAPAAPTVAISSAAVAHAVPDPAVVAISTGVLRGTVAADHRTFSGIPYAAPPVGARRWRAPAPAPLWPGVRDATRPGNPCPQMGGPDGSALIGDEDCLFLNVTTPAQDDDQRLPVMVWLPGGGFVSGAGSDYDPARLAAQGRVVVVTVNYRLGALGFLDHPALAATDAASGNFGIADQQEAMRWVRRNIDRFGGNNRNVTVFGQSAGAFSVCGHLASPESAGLFQKAIVQSGPCGNALVTRQVAQARGDEVAKDLGCSARATAAACLRRVPLARLAGIGGDRVFTSTTRIADLPWLPVVNTPLLPRQPLDALRRGVAARVPLMQGGTRDEMRPFVAVDYDLQQHPVTAEQYPTIIRRMFAANAGRVLARYPLNRYSSPSVALATVVTDWGRKIGACPVLPADGAAAKHAPVYAYEFAEDSGQTMGQLPLGAPHAAELPYLFDGAFDGPGTPAMSAEQKRLSSQMIDYWAHFAAHGDPNGAGLPRWSRYRDDGRVLSLVSGPGRPAPTGFSHAHQCEFWNTVEQPR